VSDSTSVSCDIELAADAAAAAPAAVILVDRKSIDERE